MRTLKFFVSFSVRLVLCFVRGVFPHVFASVAKQSHHRQVFSKEGLLQ